MHPISNAKHKYISIPRGFSEGRILSKNCQSRYFTPQTYQEADIVGVRPIGGLSRIEGLASQAVFTPHTKELHFFFIGQYIEEEKDYPIYESIPSHGVAIGRLSWYDYRDYRVFRLNRPDSAEIGHRIIDEISLFGRQQYGYMPIFKLVCGALAIEWLYFKQYRRFRAITAREAAPYLSGPGLICTALVQAVPLKLGINILPPGCAALPCAFTEALEAGILKEVTQSIRR